MRGVILNRIVLLQEIGLVTKQESGRIPISSSVIWEFGFVKSNWPIYLRLIGRKNLNVTLVVLNDEDSI